MKLSTKKKKSESAEFAAAAAVDCKDRLHAYLRRRLGRPHEVEDLAQEVWLRLLSVKDQTKLKGVRERMAYVYTVASTVIAKHWKGDAEERTVGLEAAHLESQQSDSILDDPAERVARQQHVDRVFDQLPPIERYMLLLHIRDGKTYEEIAEIVKEKYYPTLDKKKVKEKVHYHVGRAMGSIVATPWER